MENGMKKAHAAPSPPDPLPGSRVEIVNDNGKRWRVQSVDGLWEIMPTGHVSAAKARELCETIAAALSQPATGGVKVKALETTTEHIARDIYEGRFPQRSERQAAAFVAPDGSLSADWVAMILAEYGRVEDGRIANGPFLAVMVAEAVDRILACLTTPDGGETG